jgi:hypothetical protein
MAPFGFVYVWNEGSAQSIRYREYSASPPFYLENSVNFGYKTTLVVGPTPYVELWVNPSRSTTMRVT